MSHVIGHVHIGEPFETFRQKSMYKFKRIEAWSRRVTYRQHDPRASHGSCVVPIEYGNLL